MWATLHRSHRDNSFSFICPFCSIWPGTICFYVKHKLFERMYSLIQLVCGSGSNVILNVRIPYFYMKYEQVCKHVFS